MLLCTRTFPRKLLIHAGVEKAGESLPLSAADSRFVAESILCSFVQQSGGVALPVGSALAQVCSQEAGAPSTLGVREAPLDWAAGVRSDPTLTPTGAAEPRRSIASSFCDVMRPS